MQRYWRQNRGVRYLLTVIDVLSKYAWVRPIKRKTGAELLKAWPKGVVLKRCRQTKAKNFTIRPCNDG